MSTLCKLPTGEWAIQAPGREPVRIAVGEIFEISVGRHWLRATMGRDGTTRFKLHEGMGARFSDGRENFAKPEGKP